MMNSEVKRILDELKSAGMHTSTVSKLTGISYQKLYYAKTEHYARLSGEEQLKLKDLHKSVTDNLSA